MRPALLLFLFLAGCGTSTPPGDASVEDSTTDAATDSATTSDGSGGDAAADAPGDAGSDGSPCPPCKQKEECCTLMGSAMYGQCYQSACLACCM